MNRKMIKIQKDGLEGEIMPSSVETYEENGWTVVDDGNSDKSLGSETTATDNREEVELRSDKENIERHNLNDRSEDPNMEQE